MAGRPGGRTSARAAGCTTGSDRDRRRRTSDRTRARAGRCEAATDRRRSRRRRPAHRAWQSAAGASIAEELSMMTKDFDLKKVTTPLLLHLIAKEMRYPRWFLW